MGNKLFVEPHPDGGFSVSRPGAQRVSAKAPTQAEAIDIARQMGADKPDVARVRHTSKGKPDQWRKA